MFFDFLSMFELNGSLDEDLEGRLFEAAIPPFNLGKDLVKHFGAN